MPKRSRASRILLARKGEPLPLSQLQLKQELMADYRELLPAVSRDEARRIRGEQEIIVRYEPEKAIATLPVLLSEREDRDRLITLLDRLLADERMQHVEPIAGAGRHARAHSPRPGGGRRAPPARRGSVAERQRARWIASTRSTSACWPARKRCHRCPRRWPTRATTRR